jgi:hypothetical protein
MIASLDGTETGGCPVLHRAPPANQLRSEEEQDGPMNLALLALGVGVCIVVARRVAWPRPAAHADLGFVSQRWLTEHRLSHSSERQS